MNFAEPIAQKAWNYCLEQLYDARTHLIYDFRVSRRPATASGALPTPAEIRAGFPNPCGYGTGMEDSALNGGILLDAVLRHYEATGDAAARIMAGQLADGLLRCATAGTRGFVARSVCPADGVSHYPNSSRDQYTNLVFGLWRFYRSPLADDGQRASIRRVAADIAERMLAEVIPENGYALLRDDGRRGKFCEMWGALEPHEYLRMPMCFAAAYDMTGDERYGAQYRRYRGEASERSRPIRYESLWHLYAALQMQFSVRLLYDVDADAPYHARYEQLLAGAAAYCRAYVLENAPKLCAGDLTRYNYVYEPWRDLPLQPIPHMGDPACLKPVRNEANSAFYPLRDFGNAVHTLCLCDGAADGAVRDALLAVMNAIDYDAHSSGGPLDLLGGYCALERALRVQDDTQSNILP